jgi:hypothetical protein
VISEGDFHRTLLLRVVDHEGKLIGRFGDTPAGTDLGKFWRLSIFSGPGSSFSAQPKLWPGGTQGAALAVDR